MVFVGPFRFYDFGKPVRDLLYKDYFTQPKFTMSTYSADGVTITSSATKYGTDVDAQVKLRNVTADVKVDSDSKFIISTLFEDLAPGLNALFTFYGRDRSGSLEVQSIDEHVRVYASILMTANPTLCASGVVTSGMMGNPQVAVGAQASFNALTGSIIDYHAGVSYTQSDLNAVASILDKGKTLTASYYHIIKPLTNTAVGAEMAYFFPGNESLFVAGIQHALDPMTTVKARVDTIGIVDALIQLHWGVNSLITISGILDTRDIANRTWFRLGLSLKP